MVGVCPTLKANYWKMGVANFIYHEGWGGSYHAPCVLEVEDEKTDIVEPDN